MERTTRSGPGSRSARGPQLRSSPLRRNLACHTTSDHACATRSWRATLARARPAWPSICCIRRAPSRVPGAWMTAPPASTGRPRNRSDGCPCRWRSRPSRHAEHRITIIDTPGYADFVGEVIEGFTAVDSALITMDASESESGADTAIGLGRSMNRPALFAITRCDRENADPMAAVDALRAEFGNKIAPLQVAIGKGESFRGTVDVVHGRAWLHENGSRRQVPVPDDLAAEVALRRDQLLEAAAEADDDVLAKYLEGGEVTDAELEACLHKGVRDSILAPVLLTSAIARHRHRGAAGRHRALPALARGGEPHRGARRRRPRGVGRVRPRRTAAAPGVQDHGRPLRGPPVLLSGLVGHDPVA